MTTRRTPPADLSILTHRRLIGLLGILLPGLLVVLAAIRPTTGLGRWEILYSVSAYYYTGAVGVFVGILFALALFLFTYPGYVGERADRIVGTVGGLGALGVALFPTAAPSPLVEPTWWSTTTRHIHHGSAITLFASFIVFALWLFRKSSIPDPERRPLGKRVRNGIYTVCGVVMIVCIVWSAWALPNDRSIFLPEVIAIAAFAVSWLVKGEAYDPLLDVVGRARSEGSDH